MLAQLFFRLLLTALILTPASLSAGGQSELPSTLQAAAELPLPEAVITGLQEPFVLPGCLVTVNGRGFGPLPGKIFVGDKTVDSFVVWEEDRIVFRLPDSPMTGPLGLKIGPAVLAEALVPAPEGSMTVLWKVSPERWLKTRQARKLISATAAIQPPLFLQGEWESTGETAGTPAWGTWGGRWKLKMLPGPQDTWLAQLILTPQALAAYSLKPVKFMILDAGATGSPDQLATEVLLAFNRDWATRDAYPGIGSAPAFLPGDSSAGWDAKRRILTLEYPAR